MTSITARPAFRRAGDAPGGGSRGTPASGPDIRGPGLRRWAASGLPIAVSLSLLACLPAPGRAQGVRGEFRLTGSYVELQSLVREAIDESLVPGDGTTRVLGDTVVTCIPGGDCVYYRSGPVQSVNMLVQELALTAWPGTRGVSGRVHLRGRYGSDDLWPRSGREFEALAAYVQVDRDRWRVRAGRQNRLGGLGVYFFDGAEATWSPSLSARLTAFAGWSRAGALNQSRTGSLLAESEDAPPDEGSVLWGLEGNVRAGRELSSTVLYQREIRTDRLGLYSERVAVDAQWLAAPARFSLSSDFDVATLTVNELSLRAAGTVRPGLGGGLQVRRYAPYFELWTIWGAFSPVAYTEGSGSAEWTVSRALRVRAGGGYRDYEDTNTEADFLPIQGDGWRASTGAVLLRRGWTLTADAGVLQGFGAYRSSLDISAARELGGFRLGVFASGSQQFAEFRFGEGISRGIGAAGSWSGGSVSVDASVAVFRHLYENRPAVADYNQVRGRLGITYAIGRDPGPRAGTLGGPGS